MTDLIRLERGLADDLSSFIGRKAGDAFPEIGGQIAFLPSGRGGEAPRRGTRELLAAYSQMPWLRAIVDRVSFSVATAEWTLFRERRPGVAARASRMKGARRAAFLAGARKAGELEAIEVHDLLDVLDKGNDLLAGTVIRQLAQQHLDLVGDAFWLMELDGRGRPQELWPIPPSWVVETPRPGEKAAFRLRPPASGKDVEVPTESMVWFVNPDPANPYGRGTGVARALADELDTDELAAKHAKSWFHNRARPDLLVFADGLTADEAARLEEAWLAKQQGYQNRHKPHFLNRKIEVKELTHSFSDMQLIDLRKFERDLIIQVFGVPPEILGINESSNRATIEAADFLYARHVLLPRLDRMRSVLQAKMVPRFGDGLILDFVSPVDEDKEHELSVMKAASHAFTLDEWRARAGEDDLPDGEGEVRLGPLNLVPLSGEDLGEEPKDGERAAQQKTFPISIEPVLQVVDFKMLQSAAAPAIEAAVVDAGGALIAEIGLEIAFDVADPRVVEFLRTTGLQKLKRANDTTKLRLGRTLSEGVKRGETFDSLVTRIGDTFRSARGHRARVIARTETVQASSFGANEGMKQGGVEEKEWLSARDAQVRESHVGLDGQRTPVNGDFTSPETGATGPGPGQLGEAGEDIQCRCVLLAVIDERSIADTETKRSSLWRDREARRHTAEVAMARGLRAAFRVQERAAVRALKEIFG